MSTRIEFLAPSERPVVTALASLADANPFLAGRVDLERQALGRGFTATGEVWRVEASLDGVNPNLPRLSAQVEAFARELRRRLAAGARADREDLLRYEALVRYLLYARFASDVEELLRVPGRELPYPVDAPQLFAWGYQIRRAFHHTFRRIYGASMPAARLRAAVWQSIFTFDSGRYRRALFERMGDIPTLVVGESGTGKELVARAIALSRFVPFDAATRCFRADYTGLFHALNVAALSPTLVESELFGHRRGAFTGAIADREGWLESCGPLATVFLDEIGELDAGIQTKLLRALESRVFQRIGETRERRFSGKIVAATNRDLALEMAEGRFRSDFYYRLCADVIRTPTLREQLADAPEDLHNLLLVIARRVVGVEEAEPLAGELAEWVLRSLGRDYAWPGNVRELEQCVRNWLVRREYRPAAIAQPGPERVLADAVARGELGADELLVRYCTLVYAREGSYERAARRLGLDRRTVKARVDPSLLVELGVARRRSARPPDG